DAEKKDLPVHERTPPQEKTGVLQRPDDRPCSFDAHGHASAGLLMGTALRGAPANVQPSGIAGRAGARADPRRLGRGVETSTKKDATKGGRSG
ncbi:MAG TPA: hypothetical protein VF059_01485, partial [Casimicrobiaceae bacterium]